MVDAILSNTLYAELLARGVAIGGFGVTGLALALDRRATPMRWVGGLFFLLRYAHVIGVAGPVGRAAPRR